MNEVLRYCRTMKTGTSRPFWSATWGLAAAASMVLLTTAGCGQAAPHTAPSSAPTAKADPWAGLLAWGNHFQGPRTIPVADGGPGETLKVKFACLGPGVAKIEDAAGTVLSEIYGCAGAGQVYTGTYPWTKDRNAIRIAVDPSTRFAVQIDLKLP